jgi:FkbM family methyltransferase
MFQSLEFIWKHPISSRNRAASLTRWLRWQIGSRLLGQPVICDWLGNTKLVAETGMTGATGNLYCGLHEFVDMAFVLHFLRDGDGFADIGANIGSYSILASGFIGARTRAFEPHPETHRKLVRNVVINGIENQVKTILGAVGQEQGILRFTADRDTMNQVVADDYQGATIDVPVVRLDDSLEGFSAILWKIDVEGYETEVLEGAQRQLSQPSLRALLLETESSRILELLQTNGFERVIYDPFSRSFVESSDKTEQNSLWIRDRPFCEERLRTAPLITVSGVSF